MANQQQNALYGNQLDKGAQQAAGQTAQAEGGLAMNGGLSSGARERAAEGGANNYMNMAQNAARQNSLNQLQVGVNDQQNKIQQMGMLPGMQEQALQPMLQAQNQNVQNTMLGNQSAKPVEPKTNDNQQMQAWGANQQANAMQNSGKK